ncbi:MAG TPA: DUF255 domain-containing protein [Candidatus Cryosericum sp.]|nr:DUF255 domain-containing protein [Candidatus Cryosericum sp.]
MNARPRRSNATIVRRVLLLLALLAPAGASTGVGPAHASNRLAGESSPYLLEHADNPVDWYPWGEEAFARARREDKPIFLSIGYSSCHWCHVMERESFSDPEIAGFLNEGFVSVKVDREERPDLDTIYMSAVVSATGGGGWPMSVFLTPEKKPFHAGTYYPKPRFRDLLIAIHDAWTNQRSKLLTAADELTSAIAELQTTPASVPAAGLESDLLGAAVAAYRKSYDAKHGGFGRAPKFPPHAALSVLLRAYQERGDVEALSMVVATLLGMARGGIYDQVGGGFHRYSTDDAWQVPHFEKMLYDNALLVPVYLMAWRQSGVDELRRVAEETLAWVGREMTDAGGGFYGALDADSEGEEGRYYRWTQEQMRSALGGDAALFESYYGLEGGGPGSAAGIILHLPIDDLSFIKQQGLSPQAWRSRRDSARARLLKARLGRPQPHRDDKVLTGWNGLMISAYAVAHRATGRKADLDAARQAAIFALDSLRDRSGRVLVSWRRGRPGGPGFLDDNAFLARGLLDLHASDGDPRWLRAAAEVVRDAERFADASKGGYFFSTERPDLIARPLSLDDGSLPSGNAVMAENLARLSRLTGDLGNLKAASAILDRGAARMRLAPASHAYLILARDTVRVVASAVAPRPAVEPAAAVGKAGSPTDAGAASPSGAESVHSEPEAHIEGTIVGRANRERVVTSRAQRPRDPVRPGAAAPVEIQVEIKSGWHINSSKPTLEYLIPTRVTLEDTAGARLESVAYPEGHLVKLQFADDRLSVYEGRALMTARLLVPRETPPGPLKVPTRLTYQACSDKACLPPETVEFTVPIQVEGEPVAESPAAAPAAAPAGDETRAASAPLAAIEGEDQLSVLLRTKGLLFVVGVVFVGGLALTLTPCVYPMIPVTIGFFANQSAGAGWGRRLSLPALYVLGLALTYSVLGVLAGTSGGLFGATLQSPFIVGAMALLFVGMALWMFGVYELRLPGWMMQVGAGRSGSLGAFVMGLTLGLVAAPCIGPFIVTLLAFVGASRSAFLGFLLFFVLAVGMGLPFLVLGAFSGMLSSLPRSGVWLIYAKKVMGVGLLAVALYFLQPFLSDAVLGYASLAFALLAGIYLAWLESTRVKERWWIPARLLTGAVVVLAGLYLALPLVRAREAAPWEPYSETSFDSARAAGQPILIDFYAVWCAPCRELDRHTYSDARVLKELQRFALLKADLTNEESPLVQTLRERYDVYGVPTVVFIDRQGSDRKELRLTGFEPPAPFLERLRQVP